MQELLNIIERRLNEDDLIFSKNRIPGMIYNTPQNQDKY
jgi:hypothetical protein